MADLRNGINRLVGNTKRNKAGNQQPYVPAGNGDESGEYADMVSGSNKHYTRPEPPVEEVVEEVETVKEPKESRFSEIKSLKQKKEMYEYIARKKKYGYDNNVIIRDLRYYTGSFGDLSMFTDEELNDMIEQIEDIELNHSEESVYFLQGGKWKESKNKEKLDLIGQKYYTEQERQVYDAKKMEKYGKQSGIDRQINDIFGENCLVNFGKGFDDDYLSQVRDSSQKIVADFPELNGFVRGIGDRNSLIKYSQAKALENATPEKIEAEANKIVERYRAYGREISLEEAKRQAKEKLTKGFDLSRGGKTWLAYWSPSQKCLVMLPKSNEDIQKIESRYKTNWHSSNQLMGTYTHELGHGVVSLCDQMFEEARIRLGNDITKRNELIEIRSEYKDMISQKLKENRNVDFDNEVIRRYNETYGTNFNSIQQIKRQGSVLSYSMIKSEVRQTGLRGFNLSEYGNENTDELIAESFSAYYTGMDNKFANSVVEVVKNYYNKLRGLIK